MSSNQKYHNLRDNSQNSGMSVESKKKHKKMTKSQGANYVISVIGTTLLTLFLIIVITVCVVAVALSVYITQFADSMYDVDLDKVELSYSSFILAFNKELEDYEEIIQLSADENRIWVNLENVPQYVLNALVATEDKRYYEHAGVDWTRTVAATVNEFFGSDEEGYRQQGGSTITQQLVRDITKDNQVNIGRKLREIFRSISLEQKYSKHDIIESYINRVAFGNTVYGLGSAARHYFDKEVGELTIAESCVLVGLLPSPVSWNPYANPRESRKWQMNALWNMHDQGLISFAQYEDALNEQISFRLPISAKCRCPEGDPRCKGDYFGYIDERYEEYYGLQSNENEEEDLYYQNVEFTELVDDPFKWNEYDVKHNWYVDAALKEITVDLAELKDITLDSASDLIKRGGFRIYLSVDMEMQEKLEELFKNPYLVRSPDARYAAGTPARDTLQAGFVIMDTRGNVVAVAGGLGDKPGNDVFNRANQAQRNIGSTVKPFGVYAPAIDMDRITYSSLLLDMHGLVEEENNPGNLIPWPSNYEGDFGTGHYYPTWQALQLSTNTISARTLNLVGITNAFNFMRDKLGIKSLSNRHLTYSSLSTGSMEIKLTELAGAYQVFGTGGVYYKPAFYSKIEDHNGNIVLEKDIAGSQAIGADSAWIVNRMMHTVVNIPSGGTGPLAKNGMGQVEVIGKTGTANNLSDLLFCGLTPDYIGTLRIGFDDNREIRKQYQDHWRTLATVWSQVMSTVTPTDIPRSFPPESSVETVPYCPYSGLLKGYNCPEGLTGYYKPTNTPNYCGHGGDAGPPYQELNPIYN